MKTSRFIEVALFCCSLWPVSVLVSRDSAKRPPIEAGSSAAFDRLKKLSGEWQGTVESKQGPAATVVYRLTANGNTLMETLFPGTDHEMISMYYLDGKELVISHYCAMGNQPRMTLTRAMGDQLIFEFAGGTNLDPKKDVHIHSGKLVLLDSEHLEAEWAVYQGEKQVGSNKFFLRRRGK